MQQLGRGPRRLGVRHPDSSAACPAPRATAAPHRHPAAARHAARVSTFLCAYLPKLKIQFDDCLDRVYIVPTTTL